ncbi:AP2-like ethylene-responsive transcription factor CRL5 isoform X2 [Magnolia sinica]|uniref:AP2-like ethylene-responsive transcription factor CRL5 isoform X2 n=1 Tax=Magnolia sinica TaxID=86752 RepID=UPI002657BEF0|nr:AP2-like ethylene-responsive transcription factor CRL5 isoform X2 [Magnolia sinica]
MNMDASTDPHQHHYHYHRYQQHHHHYHQTQVAAAASPAIPTSFFLAPQMETQGGALYSQLSVMPLKSDGSLCIMEALTRSQQGVMPACSPKLEDFLGGATMGANQYGSIDREAHRPSLFVKLEVGIEIEMCTRKEGKDYCV